MDILSKCDIQLIESIIKSGKDAIVRKSNNGISVYEQKVSLRKRKEFPKEEKTK